MQPAICCICGKCPKSSVGKGDWVEFAEYTNTDTFELSHPEGLEYYCGEHIEEARKLVHLTSAEALKILRSKYPLPQPQHADHSAAEVKANQYLINGLRRIKNAISSLFFLR